MEREGRKGAPATNTHAIGYSDMPYHMVANSCRGSPRVFHGILNRNEFYSQYPVFDGIESICRYSKFDECFHVVVRGCCKLLNTVKYRQILYRN